MKANTDALVCLIFPAIVKKCQSLLFSPGVYEMFISASQIKRNYRRHFEMQSCLYHRLSMKERRVETPCGARSPYGRYLVVRA